MASGDPPVTAHTEFDDVAAQRLRRRLARAVQAPWLHAEVARRMADRLPIIRQPPQRWLDWWAQLGGGAQAVRTAYPKAQRTALEPDGLLREGSATQTPPWWSRRRRRADAVLLPGEVDPASADMVWANMMLHACADIAAQFASWHRALAVDGFLMFSTLGPGTLPELRQLYQREGWGPPFYPFADMHDLGDALVHAGFADPVMDQELLTLTWSTPSAALHELRALGGNLHASRFAGLRTPRWRDRLLQQLERRRDADGRVALSFEVVYGHAVRLRARARVAPVTTVSLQDMRADLLRQRSLP
ncbi:MAG: biotin synthase [Burkholderiaceae bacterium]|nr:biotin synthase [Burkholderiaceae bacterium]